MRHVASVLCFQAVAALAVGCGARTTLDDELFSAGSGGSSGDAGSGGSSSGSSSTGGSPGTGAVPGTGASPGTGGLPGTGGQSAGGFAGVGGAAGGVSTGGTGTAGMGAVGGVGGSFGGSPGKGDLISACESLCYPYTEVCPNQDYASPEECTIDCASGFVGTGTCRKVAVEALDCLGSNIDVGLPCETALLFAVGSCAELVAALNECGSF